MVSGVKLGGINHVSDKAQDKNYSGSKFDEIVDGMVGSESGQLYTASTVASFVLPGGELVKNGAGLLFSDLAQGAEIKEAITYACRNPEIAQAVADELKCDPKTVGMEEFARLGIFNRAVRGDAHDLEEKRDDKNIEYALSAAATVVTPWAAGLHGIKAMAAGGAAGMATGAAMEAMQQSRKNMVVLGAVQMMYAYQCDVDGNYQANRNTDEYSTQAYLVLTRGDQKTREAFAAQLGWSNGEKEPAEARIAKVLELHLKQREVERESGQPPKPTALMQAVEKDMALPMTKSVNGMLMADLGELPEMDAEKPLEMMGQKYHNMLTDPANPITLAQLGLSNLKKVRQQRLVSEIVDGPEETQMPPAGETMEQQGPRQQRMQQPVQNRAPGPQIDPNIRSAAATFRQNGVNVAPESYGSPLSEAAGRPKDEHSVWPKL